MRSLELASGVSSQPPLPAPPLPWAPDSFACTRWLFCHGIRPESLHQTGFLCPTATTTQANEGAGNAHQSKAAFLSWNSNRQMVSLHWLKFGGTYLHWPKPSNKSDISLKTESLIQGLYHNRGSYTFTPIHWFLNISCYSNTYCDSKEIDVNFILLCDFQLVNIH